VVYCSVTSRVSIAEQRYLNTGELAVEDSSKEWLNERKFDLMDIGDRQGHCFDLEGLEVLLMS